MMMKLHRLILAAALLVMGGWSELALAASGTCGVTGTASGVSTIYYDPFGTSGLQQVPLTLTLNRTNGTSNGAKTQEVYFVLTEPPGSPAYQVDVQEPGGTTYSNVLYQSNAIPAGLPTIGTNSGQVYYIFGGTSQPDSVNFNIKVTVPAGVDLSAGQPINFAIRYVCRGTGGLADVTTPTDQANAISIDVNVLSALRAYYAGSTLDFGEIGTITTPSLSGTPQRTSPSNYISVLSSGAYNVGLSSANGLLLKKPGAAAANDQIAYSLKFLGNVYNGAYGTVSAHLPPTGPIRDCQRAGLTNDNKLYIQASLLEGGSGKNPSPSYTDTLTVTVTPNISSDLGTAACGTYTVP